MEPALEGSNPSQLLQVVDPRRDNISHSVEVRVLVFVVKGHQLPAPHPQSALPESMHQEFDPLAPLDLEFSLVDFPSEQSLT
jgi:hypothetical protein